MRRMAAALVALVGCDVGAFRRASTTRHALEVTVSGDGAITSAPPGVACPGDCTHEFEEGTTVTLTASSAAGQRLDGWSGDCSGAGACAVEMTRSRRVTARFVAANSCSVRLAGDGAGRVVSDVPGIDCGEDCNQAFAAGVRVELTPTAGPRSVFTGWSGACSGTDACVVTAGASCVVTATFTAQEISVDTAAIVVGEGATRTVPFVLKVPPVSTVTVHVASTDDDALSVDPATFVLGPSDFRTPHSVTLTGVQDADAVSEAGRLTFTSTRAPTVAIDFTVTDDDRQSIVVSARTITVDERSATSFEVHLAAEPVPTATVTLATGDGLTVEPRALHFGPSDYDTAQTVTVRSLGDPDLEDHVGAVTLDTGGAEPVEIGVTVRDVDVQAVLLGATSATIAEGATDMLSVRLAAQPTGTATVTFTARDTGVVTIDPGTVTFDASNWSAPRTIDLTAEHDADARDERTVVFVETPGAATVTATVVIEDDDLWTLTVSAANGGTVTSTPAGVDCGSTCAADFDDGVQVELIASPNRGYSFAGWTGDCSGVGSTCEVRMDADHTVFASFSLINPTDCGAADLCDTGERALNGSSPVAGDDLSVGGWTELPGSNASRSYSDTFARSGGLSMRLSGYNGAGIRSAFGRATTEVTAEVWYRAEDAGGDELRISGPGGYVRILTQDFCGSTAPFMYGFVDPTGRSGHVLPIPNAPPLVQGVWYRFRIEIAGRDVRLSVYDGQTSAQAGLTLDTHAEFDAVQMTVDRCGANMDATSYWDDLAVVLDPSLVAHWSYENGVGMGVPDDAQDHEGALTGNAIYEAGRFGRALRFDGGTHVVVPFAQGLVGSEGFTFSTWIKPDALVGGNRIVLNGDCNGGSARSLYLVRVDPDGNAEFTLERTPLPSTIEAALPDTEWHHVAAVWDPSEAADNQRLYLDGALISVATFAGPLDRLADQLQLGAGASCAGGSASELFAGALDETKLFSRALDASEVAFEAAPYGRWLPMSTVDAPSGRYGHNGIWTGREYYAWGGTTGGTTSPRYDPASDAWSSINRDPPAPTGRSHFPMPWTGRELVVWSGASGTSDGARFDPDADTWTSMSQVGAPQGRFAHTGVWTGREIVFWGGEPRHEDGGRYDPRSDTWRGVSTTAAPPGLSFYDSQQALWTGREVLFWGGWYQRQAYQGGGRYDPVADEWRSISTVGQLGPRWGAPYVWTGKEVLYWGGLNNTGAGCDPCGDGAAYDPSDDSGGWRPMSTVDAPLPRGSHGAAWTGRELFVWGGHAPGTRLADGARYDPRSDRWGAVETVGAPIARSQFPAVWTGREVIVWGGNPDSGTDTNTGARYYPPRAIRHWDALATDNQPTPRTTAAVHWTGRELIVWGGFEDGVQVDGGGIWDADTERWTATSTVGQPPPLRAFVSVWTGRKMLIWGGANPQGGLTNQGWAYDPTLDEWSAMSTVDAPAPREVHAGVWTGRELVVWGGAWPSADGSGGRYDPTTDTWLPTQLPGPNPRSRHKAVWTGREMVVLEGTRPGGHRYDPHLDNWRSVSDTNAPSRRHDFTMIWTGREVIVWGGTQSGQGTQADGGRYDPRTNTWTPIPADNRFAATKHAAVWTGSHMVIWGGWNTENLATGGRYDPRDGSWTPTLDRHAPSPRVDHHAVWTGRELMIWGGTSTNPDGAKYVP